MGNPGHAIVCELTDEDEIACGRDRRPSDTGGTSDARRRIRSERPVQTRAHDRVQTRSLRLRLRRRCGAVGARIRDGAVGGRDPAQPRRSAHCRGLRTARWRRRRHRPLGARGAAIGRDAGSGGALRRRRHDAAAAPAVGAGAAASRASAVVPSAGARRLHVDRVRRDPRGPGNRPPAADPAPARRAGDEGMAGAAQPGAAGHRAIGAAGPAAGRGSGRRRPRSRRRSRRAAAGVHRHGRRSPRRVPHGAAGQGAGVRGDERPRRHLREGGLLADGGADPPGARGARCR